MINLCIKSVKVYLYIYTIVLVIKYTNTYIRTKQPNCKKGTAFSCQGEKVRIQRWWPRNSCNDVHKEAKLIALTLQLFLRHLPCHILIQFGCFCIVFNYFCIFIYPAISWLWNLFLPTFFFTILWCLWK